MQNVILAFVLITRSLAVAALLLGGGTSLRAQSVLPLSLEEAQQLAAERSRQLVAADAAVSAARELVISGSQAPDPILIAGLNNIPIEGPDAFDLTNDFMTMASIGLARELTRSDKQDARGARLEREAEAAEAERSIAVGELQRATASAWLERYYRERMHAMLLGQRSEAELQVEAAEIAYRGGRGSQSDIFAARSAVARIEDNIARAERDIAVATTNLERWAGTAARRPLSAPPPADTVALDPAELDGDLAHHPEIALLIKQEEMALADVQIARTNQRSDWSIEVMYSERGPTYSDMVSLNVTKPLQWRESRRQDRELAARLATAQELRAEREEETRAHAAEARGMLQAWQGNRERLERYAASLLPLAAERTSAAIAAYRAGTGPLDDVLGARADEIATRLDQLALEIETAMLWAELNFLLPPGHSAEESE